MRRKGRVTIDKVRPGDVLWGTGPQVVASVLVRGPARALAPREGGPRAVFIPVTPAASITQALRAAREALEASGVPDARLAAEVLLAHTLGVDRSFLYGHPEEPIEPAAAERFREAVDRRAGGEPTQYITGVQEFFGLPFRVAPGALIPRPETELLVEEALARASDGDRIVDIGTGSGCVAISIKVNRPAVRVTACEISGEALSVAKGNASTLSADVALVQCDLVASFRSGSFDVLVCNPPYVPLADLPGLQRELRFEPTEALFGGEDGLDIYRRLAGEAARVVRPSGWLILELGYNGRSAVEQILGQSDWEKTVVRTDLAGIDRLLTVRRR